MRSTRQYTRRTSPPNEEHCGPRHCPVFFLFPVPSLSRVPSKSMLTRARLILPFAFLIGLAMAATAEPRPIPVKVVIVAMFEAGQDTGDQPGELQYWVERDHLDTIYPLPAAYHPVRMNADGEMAVLTGH